MSPFTQSRRVTFALVFASALLPAATAQTSVGFDSSSILQKRYEAAQKFQAAHDLQHAAEQYRIFLADALGEAAMGRAQSGQYDRAEDDFDEALKLVPEFPTMQLEYARAALTGGHAEHASLLAKALLERYPANQKIQMEAHALLGRALLKLDKDADARAQFEAAVALDPTFDNGYELAVADLNLNDVDATRKVFAEMLTSFGDTPGIHMDFGQAYNNSDFQADAVAEFRKAIAENPKLPGVHYALAVALLATSGNSTLSEAEDELRKEIADNPKDASAYAALGHLLAKNGQSPVEQTEAESDLKRATELDARNPDAFLYLGQLYAEQKHVPEAEAALRQSIALTVDVSRNAFQVQKAHYLLGRLLMQSNDRVAADQQIALSQALLEQSRSRDQSRLSDYLQEKKTPGMGADLAPAPQAKSVTPPTEHKSEAAVEAFEKKITPAVADSYNNLGAIAASEHSYGSALMYFQRAAEWQPSLPGLDFNWGRAAFEAGAYAQAIGPLSRYIKGNPTQDGARRVLGISQFFTHDYSATRATLAPFANNPSEPPQLQFAYADSLVKTGDAAAAIPRLEALAKTSPNLPDVSAALAEAKASLRSSSQN